MTTEAFRFLDPGLLQDGRLRLRLVETRPADPARGLVPSYTFHMVHAETGEKMGRIQLRIGSSYFLERYAGHIGYSVLPAHRGQRLAARSCRLILPLAKRHGLNPVWITCNPDNWPSRRTCEILGAEMVEIVDLPPDCDMYEIGERQKCRYRLDLV